MLADVPPSPCNKPHEDTIYHSDLEAAGNPEGNTVLDKVYDQADCHGIVPAPPPDVSAVVTQPQADGMGLCEQQTESVVDRNLATSSSPGNDVDQGERCEPVASGSETAGKSSNADNHNKSILVNTSLACLPLSSFKPRLEDCGMPAPRRRPAPLSERPVNYGGGDLARLKADLEEDVPLLPPVATPPLLHILDDPEAAESPSVPPDTVYEQSFKTPIPRIVSRFAHFKEPDPRASTVLWATADCNPAFGIARTPSGLSDCDDVSVGSLVFSASPCTEKDHSSMFGSDIECLNRSVTPISPMHGPNHDCEKCRRSLEDESSRASEGTEKKVSLAGIWHSNQSIRESSDAWRSILSSRDHDDVTLSSARTSACDGNNISGAQHAQVSLLNPSSQIPRPSMRLRASLRAGIDAAEAQGALPPGPEGGVTKELDRQMDPRAPGMSLLASLGLVQTKEFPTNPDS